MHIGGISNLTILLVYSIDSKYNTLGMTSVIMLYLQMLYKWFDYFRVLTSILILDLELTESSYLL